MTMAMAFYGLGLFLLCLAQAGSNRVGDEWSVVLPPGAMRSVYSVFSLVAIVGFWGWLIAGAALFGMLPTLGCLVVAAATAYAVSKAVHPGYGATFVVFGTPLAGLCAVIAIAVR